MFRKEQYRSPLMKVGEVCGLAFVTSTVFFWFPYWINAKCYPAVETFSENVFLSQYNCPKGFFNPLATLFFNTEGTVLQFMTGAFEQE